MNELKKLAALTALNNLLAERSFNICALDRVASMLNIQPGGDSYKLLTTLHCINYDKMPKELRDAIPGLIEEILGVAPVFQFATLTPSVIEMQPAPPPPREAPEARGVLHMLGFGGRK